MHRVVTKILLDAPPCDSNRHLDEPRVPAARHGYLLCESCLEGVESALIDLPDWYAQCEVTPQPGTRPVRGTREYDMLQVRADILETLAAWCALVASQRRVRVPEKPGVAPMTKFLAVHLQWLTTRPGAVEFADDLAELGLAVLDVLDPEPDSLGPVGPCPWPGCDEQLFPAADESADAQYLRCGAGHRWPPDQWPGLDDELPDTPDRDDPGREQS
jgi:hypothetical protein